MKISSFFKISVWIIACIPISNTFAWWDQSHQLISYIAGETVSPITHMKVMQLLQEPIAEPGSIILSENTSTFGTAASWPDSLKKHRSDGTYASHTGCHYIDLSMDKDFAGLWIDDETAQNALKVSMQESKINSITCLKSAIKSLSEPSQSMVEQAIALRFLLHIVGDIAQPLHNISLIDNNEKDYCGRKTHFPSTILIPTTDGTTIPQTTLHKLWDATLGLFLQFPYNEADITLGIFAKSDLALMPHFRDKLYSLQSTHTIFNEILTSSQSIEEWVIEGYKIAAKEAYSDLSARWGIYSIMRHHVIEKQLAKGSYRLSFLLDAIFDPENARTNFQTLVNDIKNDHTIYPFVMPGMLAITPHAF